MLHSALKILLFISAVSILYTLGSLAQDNYQSESFMSIYSEGEKVGFTKILIDNSADATRVEENSEINVTLLGNEQTVTIDAQYFLDDFLLQSFDFQMSSEAGDLSSSGAVEGEDLKVKVKSVSGETDLFLTAKEGLTIFALLPKWLAKRPMKVGEVYEIRLFEPSAAIMGADAEDLISINKVEALEVVETKHSGEIETFRVATEFMGSYYTSWITPQGEVIKQIIPPGLTAYNEPGTEKNTGSLATFDITDKTSIPTDVEIKNPRSLEYLRARLSGLDDMDEKSINDGYRQLYENNVIEIRPRDITSPADYELPYKALAQKDFLLPTSLVQSDDEQIKAKARKIVKNETDPVKAASEISAWVYKNLKKEGTVSLPNALDVLETRKGDCNEHAALFAALSRASGIPTKIVMGTIYIDGRFYYHAWNEVFLGQWVAVDSTYGQLPADATHIKLIEGDLKKSGEIMKVVGKIKIEILDAT